MMKISSFLASAVLVLTVLLQGCNVGGEISKTLNLSEKDSGNTFRVRVGDVVFVKLSENPTTGYLWHTVPASAGEGVLKFSGKDYLPPKDKTLCGAPGTRNFGYLVSDTGKADLCMEYRRPWDKKPKDVQRVIFHFISELPQK